MPPVFLKILAKSTIPAKPIPHETRRISHRMSGYLDCSPEILELCSQMPLATTTAPSPKSDSQTSLRMRCPYCESEMRPGRVKMGYTAVGWLFAGWSYLTLFFMSQDAKRLAVLGRYQEKDAGRCDACGTLVVAGERSRQVECTECSTIIPPGHGTCPSCGLEYRPPHEPVDF